MKARTDSSGGCELLETESVPYYPNKFKCKVDYEQPPPVDVQLISNIRDDSHIAHAFYQDGMLTLYAPAEGQGMVRVSYSNEWKNHRYTKEIFWENGECDPITLSALKQVRVNIEPYIEGISYALSVCDHRSSVDGESFDIFIESEALPCRVIASYQSGLIRVESRAKIQKDTTAITLLFEEEPVGGIGISIFKEEDGHIVVDAVMEGSSSDLEGIEEGDVVLSVDGVPTPSLSVPEFIVLVTGEIGTEVSIEILRGGEAAPLTLERQFLDENMKPR